MEKEISAEFRVALDLFEEALKNWRLCKLWAVKAESLADLADRLKRIHSL